MLYISQTLANPTKQGGAMPISSIEDPLDGITGVLANHAHSLKAVLLTFIAVSWYNVFELIVLVLCTFRRWRGLYFWSLLLSGCLGVLPYSLGFLLKFFTLTVSSTLSVTLLTLGWWCMVTGQSLVLYSRLHLVLRDERLLRRVLIMIWVNVVALHVPTTVLTYASNAHDRSPRFVRGYNIMEKIQMTGFTIQELIISALYVVETIQLLRLGWDRTKRKIMHELVRINVIMFIMDLALLGLEYASLYAIQITLKGAIYSIKLKLEFAVLGRLVDVVHADRQPNPPTFAEPVPLNPMGTSVSSSRRGLLDLFALPVPPAAKSHPQPAQPGGLAAGKTNVAEISTWIEGNPRNNET